MFLSRSSSAMSVGSESSDTLMSPRTFRPSSSQGMREDNSDKHLGKGCKQEDFDEARFGKGCCPRTRDCQLLDEFDDIKKATSKKGHRLNVREKDTSRQLSFRQARRCPDTSPRTRKAWHARLQRAKVPTRQRSSWQTRSTINSEFGITRKIVATTTDNGANYCAAFAHFGDNQDDPLAVAPEHEDPDGGDVAIVSVHDLLEEEVEDEAEDLPKLPTQRRCAAHTLNLLATTDVSKVVGWNYGTGRQARQPFTKAAAKAQGLGTCTTGPLWWPTRSGCGGQKAEYTPAQLDGAQGPRDHRGLNEVMKSEAAGKRAAAPVFTEEDKEILQEYCKVMKPVAICLDRLQAEVNAYMGSSCPT
ncbi:hypothetical protein GWK47_021863 [Chionoecetes opilio]|uniref:Uncharacterized protein n=1 Tax=Chionoecetes opilio TaxID=41210 RepID=A0A8J4XXC5_CHIOP|nr:hypothetical protein GWK47_021863 [Chionoecetes opilio]